MNTDTTRAKHGGGVWCARAPGGRKWFPGLLILLAVWDGVGGDDEGGVGISNPDLISHAQAAENGQGAGFDAHGGAEQRLGVTGDGCKESGCAHEDNPDVTWPEKDIQWREITRTVNVPVTIEKPICGGDTGVGADIVPYIDGAIAEIDQSERTQISGANVVLMDETATSWRVGLALKTFNVRNGRVVRTDPERTDGKAVITTYCREM